MSLYNNYSGIAAWATIRAVLFAAVLSLGLLFHASAFSADAKPQTLTGAQAQKSPQAELVLVYEKTLIFEGIDAASKYMTPKRQESMQAMLKEFGAEGFKEFQTKMRDAPMGEARRKHIEKVVVEGDRAVLTARSGPNFVDEIPLLRMKDGWKIAVRGE